MLFHGHAIYKDPSPQTIYWKSTNIVKTYKGYSQLVASLKIKHNSLNFLVRNYKLTEEEERQDGSQSLLLMFIRIKHRLYFFFHLEFVCIHVYSSL